MTKPVPPRIESPKSFIALGARELIILGVALAVAIMIVVLKIGFVMRVGLVVLVVGLGLSVAFGRDRQTGRTIEQYLVNLLRYQTRARFRQRGAAPTHQPKRAMHALQPESVEADHPEPAPTRRNTMGRMYVRPLPLGPGLLLSVLSFSFLAMLLAWIWLGGLSEFQLWLGRTRF